MHDYYASVNMSGLQKQMFMAEHRPVPAMTPHAAARCLTRNDVDYVPIREAAGRVATTLWVVYPPGIATIVPGERLDEHTRPMLDYLIAFEKASNLFPGFDAEIQGLYREIGPNGQISFHTYVAREGER
jgi:arginine/lysine/ornithine decarboxylase